MSNTANPASPVSSNNTAQAYTMQPDYARVVAEQFVQQYYHVLKSYSKHLHRFYMEDSSFTVSVKDLQAETRTAKGAEIQGLVTECLPDAQADCQSFDAQFVVLPGYPSQDAYYTQMPILIQSSGVLLSAGKTYNFAQTFFLAPFDSANRGPGYYVANDILRLSQADRPATAAPSENGVAAAPARVPEAKAPETQRSATPTSTTPTPAAPTPAPAPAPKPQHIPASAPEPTTTKPDAPAQKSPTKKPAEVAPQAQPAPQPAPAAPPAKPKSWAALLGSKPAEATPAPTPAPVQPVQEAPRAPAPQEAAPSRPAPSEEPSSSAPAASSASEEYSSHAVMVQDLPEISSQEVFAVMVKFGPIKGGANAVAVRPYKDTFTAYFEYETKEALEDAVAAELTIKETKVKVVERRRPSGMRKDGRGGRGGRFSSGRERRPDSFSRRPAPCANGEQPGESKADGARWQSDRGDRPERAARGDRGRGPRGGRGRGRGRFGDAGAQSGSPRAAGQEASTAAGADA